MATAKRHANHAPEPTEAAIDEDYENRLDHFFHTDLTIRLASRILHEYVFRNSFRVQWAGSIEMEYFRSPHVRRALVKLLLELRNQLALKHYAAIYVCKDMVAWTREFVACTTFSGALAMEKIALPCDIVRPEMGSFVQISPLGDLGLKRVIEFRPKNDEYERAYEFHVIDTGARFFQSQETFGRRLRPVSDFAALFARRREIDEARTYQMNAAFALAHPIGFVTANRMPREDIDSVDDATLVAARSLEEARTHGAAVHMQKYTLPESARIIKRLQHAMGAATGRKVGMDSVLTDARDGETVRKALVEEYGRVDPTENLVTIPDYITVTTPPPAGVVVDVQTLENEYTNLVCSVMNVPLALYRTHVEQSRTSGSSNVHMAEAIISRSIEHEQRVYSEIFEWVYTVAFGSLDRQLMQSLADDIDQLEDTARDTDDARRVFKLVSKMLNRTSSSLATLEFELLTVTSSESLQALVRAQQLGLVDRHLVERNAQRHFGHTINYDPERFAEKGNPALQGAKNAPLGADIDEGGTSASSPSATSSGAEKKKKKSDAGDERPSKRSKKE